MKPGATIAELFATVEPANVDLANGESVEVYLAKDAGKVQQIILPISGPGLWSTMRGYISVAPDGNTVKGIRFYEHAETPGLGDQIDKADWRKLWVDKKLYGDDGTPRIEVVRGFVQRDANPDATLPHEILGGLYSDVGKKDLAIAELQKALMLEKDK